MRAAAGASGSPTRCSPTLALTTRVEGGAPVDGLLSGSLRYYRPTGSSGVFFAGFTAGIGHDLDADHELTLGGDTGLRGYPLRYQAGSATALLSLEQRFFSKLLAVAAG